jgi:hypothetical protein
MNKSICKDPDCVDYGSFCRRPGHAPQEVKKKKPIAQVSAKRAKINKELYSPVQQEVLTERPFCELRLPGCTGKAQGVHHVGGKENTAKLIDKKKMKAACNHCNNLLESKDAVARAAGLKESKHVPNYKRQK